MPLECIALCHARFTVRRHSHYSFGSLTLTSQKPKRTSQFPARCSSGLFWNHKLGININVSQCQCHGEHVSCMKTVKGGATCLLSFDPDPTHADCIRHPCLQPLVTSWAVGVQTTTQNAGAPTQPSSKIIPSTFSVSQEQFNSFFTKVTHKSLPSRSLRLEPGPTTPRAAPLARRCPASRIPPAGTG